MSGINIYSAYICILYMSGINIYIYVRDTDIHIYIYIYVRDKYTVYTHKDIYEGQIYTSMHIYIRVCIGKNLPLTGSLLHFSHCNYNYCNESSISRYNKLTGIQKSNRRMLYPMLKTARLLIDHSTAVSRYQNIQVLSS